MPLHHVIASAARERSSAPAVIESSTGSRMDYAMLDRISDRLRDRLAALGVRRGDQVGIYLRKSDGISI